jgi:hypothetical protein
MKAPLPARPPALSVANCQIRRKYRQLFSTKMPTKPGPKGPSRAISTDIRHFPARVLVVHTASYGQRRSQGYAPQPPVHRGPASHFRM